MFSTCTSGFALLLNNQQRPENTKCMGSCILLEEDPMLIFVDECPVVSQDREVAADTQ